ncbi:MAG: hypothetical protein GXP31_19450 [Kiritimatiellaeota bacterium]|nr:hypothetical protein [Kiritimatiellota bacterium]
MSEFRIFWGETHDNTLQFENSPTPFDESLRRAASHLDFYAAAYYTACSSAFQPGGHLSESDRPSRIPLEGWKSPERLEREWALVNEICRDCNRPGEFVAFPGYEWQGNGSSGDHNVFALEAGLPIFRVNTLAELYAALEPWRGKALAIPHHTAYRPGVRGRDWSVYDEELSPFTEIFSIHGCSETDEEWVGMRGNPHMGPGIGPGTWQAALDRGHRLGAICSTDNWGEMPGCYGHGRMACLARELSREALWEAFRARRVYGVTGDRIQLEFTVNGAQMGRIITADGTRRVRVRVVGADALDRIEVLRNGRVIATHCHQGAWAPPADGRRSRFKMRVEAGWGPRPNEMPVQTRDWDGRVRVDGGCFVGVEKCWISPGHGEPQFRGDTARFGLRTSTRNTGARWQNSEIFEFEARPESRLELQMNGAVETGTVAEFATASREIWFKDECVRMLEDAFGIAPGSPERADIYHHLAFKVKVHRPIPAAAYTAEFDFDDAEPFGREIHYRVRVEQRNGQRAWSSPVWVRPA